MSHQTVEKKVTHVLCNWLSSHGFNAETRAEDFADGNKYAQLYYEIMPTDVDRRVYDESHCFQNRLVNWQHINYKLLLPINLWQSVEQLRRFAKPVPGAVDELLKQLMYKEYAPIKDKMNSVPSRAFEHRAPLTQTLGLSKGNASQKLTSKKAAKMQKTYNFKRAVSYIKNTFNEQNTEHFIEQAKNSFSKTSSFFKNYFYKNANEVGAANKAKQQHLYADGMGSLAFDDHVTDDDMPLINLTAVARNLSAGLTRFGFCKTPVPMNADQTRSSRQTMVDKKTNSSRQSNDPTNCISLEETDVRLKQLQQHLDAIEQSRHANISQQTLNVEQKSLHNYAGSGKSIQLKLQLSDAAAKVRADQQNSKHCNTIAKPTEQSVQLSKIAACILDMHKELKMQRDNKRAKIEAKAAIRKRKNNKLVLGMAQHYSVTKSNSKCALLPTKSSSYMNRSWQMSKQDFLSRKQKHWLIEQLIELKKQEGREKVYTQNLDLRTLNDNKEFINYKVYKEDLRRKELDIDKLNEQIWHLEFAKMQEKRKRKLLQNQFNDLCRSLIMSRKPAYVGIFYKHFQQMRNRRLYKNKQILWPTC